MLPLRARLDLGDITIKGYSAIPKAQALQDPRWGNPTPLQRCRRCIPQPQPTGQFL